MTPFSLRPISLSFIVFRTDPPSLRRPVAAYNLTTTRTPVICQLRKNVHVISALVSASYKKSKNCTQDSMAIANVAVGLSQ
jgi:hypothetical protein